jgi:hypothetical protein
MGILVSKRDQFIKVQLIKPDVDGGTANIKVFAQNRLVVYQLHRWMEDSRG